MNYDELAHSELLIWKNKLIKRSGFLSRVSKGAQNKINSLIPEKAHTIITESIKKVSQAALVGSEYTTSKPLLGDISLLEREKKVTKTINDYKKLAATEGAGTGAVGFVGSLADFPLLLSIKMKFLFKTASLYGYDVKEKDERLFILHVFQLAFSGDDHRSKMLAIIENWDTNTTNREEIDWHLFQQEYRDHIDLAKMLQLIPGLGAAFGAYANFNLLDELGETAMNAYRIRYFTLKKHHRIQL